MVFFVLLLANVAFPAYTYLAATADRDRANALAQQIDPERIRIVSPEEAARIAASRKSAAAPACLEWGAFATTELAKAVEAIEGLAPGLKTRERRVEDAARWWVVIPPLANRNAAAARVAELRKLGIEDLYVIDDEAGGYRNGISLGLFRSEDGAKTRLEALEKRGAKGARVVARDATTRIYLQVREPPEDLRTRVAELRTAWPAADLKDCAAEAKQ
jgi:hypothetical protein